MAAILRSAVGKTARRAFSSMEGTLSGRPLHGGHSTNYTAKVDASRINQFPKPAEVDLLVKKIEDTARKEMLIEYNERLAQEKSTIGSQNLLGVALPCFLALSYVGVYLAGHRFGFRHAVKEGYEASRNKH